MGGFEEMTAAEYRARFQNGTKSVAAGKPVKARHALKPNKLGAEVTERDGIRFRSKLEALYYDYLLRRKDAGEVVGFIRQPPFDTGGGTKYTADFLVFYADSRVVVIDVKGHETKGFRRSWRQVRARNPWLTFQLVKRGEF